MPLSGLARPGYLFTSDRELSNSLINAICYDRTGHIWVATEDGLNRYDGSKFTTYKSVAADSTSLSRNFVYALFQDSEGHVFAATYGGVQMYLPDTDTFTPVARYSGSGAPGSSATDIIERTNGDLWVIGNDPAQLVVNPDNTISLKDLSLPEYLTYTETGIEDAMGNVWMSKDRAGVYRVAPDRKVYHYLGAPGDAIVKCFAIGADRTLYAGSINRGILRYDEASDKFVSVNTPATEHMSILDIYTDRTGILFLATDGGGLKTYDPATENIADYPLDARDAGRLKVHAVTKDEYGNLWVGLYQKGVMMEPCSAYPFHTLSRGSRPAGLIGEACVTSIWRDADNTLWVGTDNDAIYAVDADFASSRHITAGVPPVVMSLFQDSARQLWVGSYSHGMGVLDRATGKFRKVPLRSRDGVEIDRVYGFAEDAGGRIWVASMGNGVVVYDPSAGSTSYLPAQSDTINSWVTSVCCDKSADNIYLGTYDGIYRVSANGHSISRSLRDTIVNTIYIDPMSGCLWVGTATGLVKMGMDMSVMRIYTSADGLSSDMVYSIENDGRYLWLSTNAGLSRLDTRNGAFSNFYVDDGLQSNEFFKKASFRDARGNLFFGGINGITWFNPHLIEVSGRKLEVKLTGFYVEGEQMHATLDNPLEFSLGAGKNTFSVEFNTRQFVRSSHVEFQYSLDGKEWENMPHKNVNSLGDGGNLLTFTNIESGKHKLRIRAVSNGVESESLEIEVDIAPPWYAGTWAKLTYMLLVLVAVWLLYKLLARFEADRRRETERRHEVEIRESKLQFFTNISHEIRTPLSLVISPLESLISSDSDSERQTIYRTIMRNARRILRLVNEIMDLRRIDNKQMKMAFRPVRLVGFVSDLYSMFAQATAHKNIRFEFTYSGYNDTEVWVDYSNFDKILMNLLSNAVKYTPDGGSITIALGSGSDAQAQPPLDRYVEISVTDTGIGIPEGERKHIFDRFYRVHNNNAGGTGIGLHLTRSLVELHYGAITVEDNPEGRGTRFVVRIPQGDSHLLPSQKCTDSCNYTPPEVENTVYEAEPVAETVPKVKSGPLVYVAEDDQEIRAYLARVLGREFRVETFSDGGKVLEAAHRDVPDLIISDVMMPGTDGITLTRKIRQNIQLNSIPVILLTARNTEDANIAGVESGADVFMTKPFNTDVLVHTVHNLIQGRRTLRNVYSGAQDQESRMEDIEVNSSDDRLLQRVMKVVNSNLSNPNITVEDIAKEIGISRVHLYRKLKELTNQSARDFIRNIRLKQAARLMREKRLSVAEVSYIVGFRHPGNFSASFKELFGETPSAYSDRHHKPEA